MARPIWQRSDDDLYLFHHTTAEAAEQIATTGVFRVGHANFLGPTGIYAGNDDPEKVTLEWVQVEYFFGLWPPEALGGVAVFRGDDEVQPFERCSDAAWVLPAPIGPLEVADVVVGWGRQEPDSSWWWSAGLLV